MERIIATHLAKAQGAKDRFAESEIIWLALNKPRVRYSRKQNLDQRFFSMLAFGGAGSCWYWTGRLHRGYGVLSQVWSAHRFSYAFFRGQIPKGMSVLHRCDVKNCVNPEHLFLGTQAENVRDMTRKGRGRNGGLRGEQIANAKLTWAKVEKIRALRSQEKMTFKKIGDLFGVTDATISYVCRGKTWRTDV